MAIKARPYGGKPGIAVAKETNSHLLTVWPLKLWGALAPVAPRRKTVWKIKGKETISVIQFSVRRNLHAVQSLDKCMATFLRHTWQLCWFTQTEVWLCSNMLAVNRQLGKHFFKSALATKPQMFNSTLNQLAMNTTLLWSILYLSQLSELNPLEGVPAQHITFPLLEDNYFHFSHFSMCRSTTDFLLRYYTLADNCANASSCSYPLWLGLEWTGNRKLNVFYDFADSVCETTVLNINNHT